MSDEKTFERDFRKHLKAKPEVLKKLIEQARVEKARGARKVSIRKIWEEVRQRNPQFGGLNDHFHSRYSRLIMEREADLNGFFYTRRLRSE
jgi:hypothetical protein